MAVNLVAESKKIDEAMALEMELVRKEFEEKQVALAKEMEVSKAASAQGDRSENAEWQIAQDNIAKLNSEILKLSNKISIFDEFSTRYIPCGRVTEGSTILLYDRQYEEELVIKIYPAGLGEARLRAVSVATPVGQAVLGRVAGDSVVARAPMGELTYDIKEVY